MTRVCNPDRSKQSKMTDGLVFVGHVRWSVLTYLHSGVRWEGFEDKNFESSIFKDSQKYLRLRQPIPWTQATLV